MPSAPPPKPSSSLSLQHSHSSHIMFSTIRSAFISTFIPRPLPNFLSASSVSSFVSRSRQQCRTLSKSPPTRTPKRTRMSEDPPNVTSSSLSSPTGVIPADLRQEMTRSYMEYAMSVILGRAMPDVRDGFKPVHRRILYAMYRLRLPSSGPFRKSARVVGEVLGKYHPHGDSAVYDALVRMAQPFSMSLPLVDGHGNFGSTDGDPPAAMRYTECRLAPVTQHAILPDLDSGDNVVDFFPNFDSSEQEPVVLPARYPNLLVNGSSGIAVGMATNVPPHNITEIVNACIAFIQNPNLNDEDLFNIVPAPDFPTGGFILGSSDAQEVYLTGRGRVVVRACVHVEIIHPDGTTSPLDSDTESHPQTKGKMSKSRGDGRQKRREALVVTQLPYQVNKAVLVGKMAALVNEKKLDGISDLRDESDRTGTRIVIELKRDAIPSLVLRSLFKKTALQTSFSANMMALDNGRFPKRFTLREFLSRFIDFRRQTVRRRTEFELKQAQDRLHIVSGFVIVLSDVDQAVALVRAAKDTASARTALIDAFELSETQASAVLELQLRRLTALEMDKLESERKQLQTLVSTLAGILESPRKLDDVLVSELRHVKSKYGTPRRSVILHPRGNNTNSRSFSSSSSEAAAAAAAAPGSDMLDDIDELTLIQNVQSVITVTRHGYIKRMRTSLFESQNRGTRGKRGVGRLREGDRINHLFTCMTHDPLIAISADGVAYPLSAHKVPAAAPGSRGVPMFQLVSAVPDGQATDFAAVVPVADPQSANDFLLLLSKNGYVKRVAISQVVRKDSRGKRVISLGEGDQLSFVKRCREGDSVIIASQRGQVLRFFTDAAHLRSSGRLSRGVQSMKLNKGDQLADMDVIEAPQIDEQTVKVVHDDVREDDVEEDEEEEEEESDIVDEEEDMEGENEDEQFLLMVTKHGKGKRVRASAFTPRGRGGKGILAMRVDHDAQVGKLTKDSSHKTGTNEDDDDRDCVVASQTCRIGDSVMLVASDGTIVRTKVAKIPVQGRTARGVRLQRLADDVTVAAVVVIKANVLGDEDDDEDDDVVELNGENNDEDDEDDNFLDEVPV